MRNLVIDVVLAHEKNSNKWFWKDWERFYARDAWSYGYADCGD